MYFYWMTDIKISLFFADIIVRLAQSSSESEMDAQLPLDVSLIEQVVEVDFSESLQAFQDTVPKYMKNKKANRQKKKVKKDGKVYVFNRWLYQINSWHLAACQ